MSATGLNQRSQQLLVGSTGEVLIAYVKSKFSDTIFTLN